MRTRAALIILLLHATPALADAGPPQGEVVAVTGSECSDYLAVKTDDGYALIQWYGGYTPDKGDKVSGDFASFGTRTIQVQPGGKSMRVWVEDYGLSLDDANDKLQSKCR